jgi:hypothetical protein
MNIVHHCLVQSVLDATGKKIRIKTIDSKFSTPLFVSCSRKHRANLPVGSKFMIDVKYIEPKNKKPYLISRTPFLFGQLSLF